VRPSILSPFSYTQDRLNRRGRAAPISIRFSLFSDFQTILTVPARKNFLFLDFFEKNTAFFGVKTAKNEKYVVTTIDLVPTRGVESKAGYVNVMRRLPYTYQAILIKRRLFGEQPLEQV
jgi:hypothetical protein